MHAEHADRTRLNEPSDSITGRAFIVLNPLGAGFLEKVYKTPQHLNCATQEWRGGMPHAKTAPLPRPVQPGLPPGRPGVRRGRRPVRIAMPSPQLVRSGRDRRTGHHRRATHRL